LEFILDNTEKIELLTNAINQMFDTSYDCYIVGSSMIKNCDYNDVDVVVCYNNSTNKTENKITTFVFNSLVKNEEVNFSLLKNLKSDNINITSLPHYNIKTGTSYILDKNELTEEEFNSIRAAQTATIAYKTNFLNNLIDEENQNERCDYLLSLLSVIPKKYIKLNEQELALKDWKYTDYVIRIIAPLGLLLELSNFEVWWRINGLPFEKRGEFVYCYCNEIDPQHIDLFNNLITQGIIQKEDIPVEE
jgi:hypothetical protein